MGMYVCVCVCACVRAYMCVHAYMVCVHAVCEYCLAQQVYIEDIACVIIMQLSMIKMLVGSVSFQLLGSTQLTQNYNHLSPTDMQVIHNQLSLETLHVIICIKRTIGSSQLLQALSCTFSTNGEKKERNMPATLCCRSTAGMYVG